MSMITDSPGLSKKIARPASIELWFSDKGKFDEAVTLYCLMLGLPNNTAPGDTSCSLRLVGNLELLLFFDAAQPGNSNSTVVYWEVKGNMHVDIEDVYNELIRGRKFTGVMPPKSEPAKPDRLPTERAILRDSSGNLVGLTINPPVPLMTEGVGFNSQEFRAADEKAMTINPPLP